MLDARDPLRPPERPQQVILAVALVLALLGLHLDRGAAPAPAGPDAASGGGGGAQLAPGARGASITAESLKAHVAFLASDELEGRATGSEGCSRAGEYLAAQLAAAGLEPAGDDGTFLQHFEFGLREYSGLPQLTCTGPEGAFTATYGVDFDSLRGLHSGAQLEVRVCRTAEDLPEPDPGLALFLLGNSRERVAWLEGRVGDGLVLWAGSKRAGSEQVRPPRARHWTGADRPSPLPGVRIRGPLMERFKAGEITGLRLEVPVADRMPPAFNVVGRLPGRGELADEVIVYTAHYDHIGLKHAAPSASGGAEATAEPGSGGESQDGASEVQPPDLIYNGADDDASGCAAVIELARSLVSEAQASEGPRRTQLFLLVTGEEIGLVGTFAYLEQPVEPLERTVCNLNFEMIGRPDALAGGAGNLWLTGFERTNLGPEFLAQGIEIEVDPHPEMRFFERSDNIAFALRGIVAQSLSSYDLHEDYHHVTDELESLDFEHMQVCVRTAFEAAVALADGRIDPAWEPGGEPTRSR